MSDSDCEEDCTQIRIPAVNRTANYHFLPPMTGLPLHIHELQYYHQLPSFVLSVLGLGKWVIIGVLFDLRTTSFIISRFILNFGPYYLSPDPSRWWGSLSSMLWSSFRWHGTSGKCISAMNKKWIKKLKKTQCKNTIFGLTRGYLRTVEGNTSRTPLS